MDKIKIKDLEIYSHHGVYQEENVLGQKFLVSADLYTHTRMAGQKDDMACSINYASVCRFIENYMRENTRKLIESVAENLAEQILLNYPLVKKIRLEVKKPWAPILLPLDTVSVEILRAWHRTYLSIGSNMGDKENNLRQSIELLRKNPKIRIGMVSPFLVTKPVGEVEQDDFLNGAVELFTLLSPEELLDAIEEIEAALKRVRTVRWGPRTIDLDILLYDEEIIRTRRLTIPHKEMHRRAFVLEPLEAIGPYALHPVLKKSIMELKEML